MSSSIHAVDFNPGDNRILNQMLEHAGYVTARMKPLSGPLSAQSHAVLLRFMSGVMCAADADRTSETPPVSAFGRP